MFDIDAYLKLTRQKLTRTEFGAAIRLVQKGRKVLDLIPEKDSLDEEQSGPDTASQA